MKNHQTLFLAAAWALLAGCTSTRSISNSSYRDARPASGRAPGQPSDPGFEYRGELSQSGAMFPDGPMVGELSKHFTVVPFSGVPPGKDSIGSLETRDSAGFSRS